jgi:hypothetical protein
MAEKLSSLPIARPGAVQDRSTRAGLTDARRQVQVIDGSFHSRAGGVHGDILSDEHANTDLTKSWRTSCSFPFRSSLSAAKPFAAPSTNPEQLTTSISMHSGRGRSWTVASPPLRRQKVEPNDLRQQIQRHDEENNDLQSLIHEFRRQNPAPGARDSQIRRRAGRNDGPAVVRVRLSV